MKRASLLALSLASLIASGSAMAVADIKGYYLGAMAGYSQLEAGDFDESAVSYGLYGGYYFSKNFALESTYVLTDNFVDVGDVKANQLSLAAKFHHYFDNTYSMFIKAGMAATKVDADLDYDGDGWLWGAGFNMAFKNGVNVRIAYEMLYTDLDASGLEQQVESDWGNVYLGVHYQF
ncbi:MULTISPECIES: outer membrane beta-barrel protein [Shewanella]|uniref:Cell envelope biogenesis protein OmpA n=1 Tax=Shewanella marisflavi TaxID=260364 RepID=A0AAC9XN03_9GAMM|nr:outer membrane beta-barrel protein [Shewanella marisflavi]ASJ96158.1 cell envelope biogenesis protein OmpA [Shewanella marisflavi]MCL1042001.1 porin family protein [Shewanella marisflavi]